MIAPRGWNTWDYASYNSFCFLDKGRFEIEARIRIFDEKSLSLLSDFRWKDLREVGPHAADGSYSMNRFLADGTLFEVESASDGDNLFCSIRPVEETGKRIVVEIVPAGGDPVCDDKGSLRVGGWSVSMSGFRFKNGFFVKSNHDYIVSEENKGGVFAITRKKKRIAARDIKAGIKAACISHRHSLPTGDGFLQDAVEGVTRAVTWNTIFDRREKGICTPVSRDWCKDWQGALLFCWDTFLIGMLASVQDDQLPWHNFSAVLGGATPKGFVPNYAISSGVKSFDRSQPPLGAYCVWKTYQSCPDKKKLAELYPALLKWHRWWPKDRDGNSDGLLEWGSNPEPHYEFPEILPFNPHIQHAHICAAYESGQDNSPVFDEIPYNEEKNVLECSDIGLNSLYAMDAEALSLIAEELGKTGDAARLAKEYQTMKRRIDEKLWCGDDGIYYCRMWDGEFLKRLSPTNFFPMIAGIPSREQAERMVREHLLNPDEFWGDYSAPTISKNDPAFDDNNYWRGRIWPPFNFLLYEGLKRYDFHDVANEFAMQSLDAFLKNWRRDNHVCENYNSVNGEGTDVSNSDPLYAWGALMGYIGITELVDANSREGIRFGNLSPAGGSVKKVSIAGHRYDVSISGTGLVVLRDEKRFLDTDAPAIVRKLDIKSRTVSAEVISIHASSITFHGLKPGTRYRFTINGSESHISSGSRGTAVVRL